VRLAHPRRPAPGRRVELPARRRGRRGRVRSGCRPRPAASRRARRAHDRLPRGAAARARTIGGRHVTALRPGAAGVDILLLWVMFALAGASWWPVYASSAFLVAAVAAVLLGTLIALLGAMFRWAAWVVLLVTAGTFAPVGVPLAVPAKAVVGVLPSLDGLLDLFAGVALGWKQLLTITLPVGDYQALLVPVFALLLTSSVLAVSTSLRTRVGESALVPVLVVFV